MVTTNKSEDNNAPPRGAQRPEIAAILNAGQVGRGNALVTAIIAAGTIAVVVMYIAVFALGNDDVDRSAFTAPITAEPAAVTPAETAPAETPAATVAPISVAGPNLAITDPADDARFSVRNIVLSGQADPNTTINVTITDADLPAQVDASGAWTFDAELESGENILLVTAADASGNLTQNTIRVFYDRPAPTPPATAPTAAPITDTTSSFWHSDIATGAIPSTSIIGSTSPGALISATSPYGSATTASDAGGAWSIDLAFFGAPVGEEFVVTVAVTPTQSATTTQAFTFTYLGTN